MVSTHELPLDYSFDIDDQHYDLEELRLNPINQKIFGKEKGKVRNAYDIKLEGADNVGNKVEFFLNSASGGELVFKYNNINGNLADEVTSITIAPYAAKFPEKS